MVTTEQLSMFVEECIANISLADFCERDKKGRTVFVSDEAIANFQQAIKEACDEFLRNHN